MIARVVPDIPSFAVDDGFRYSIPADLTIDVGSIVRVPLGGRKVRGFVVAIEKGSAEGMKPIRGRSGAADVFNPRLLQTLRWAAQHYVAPLSVLLRRAAPPNLPRITKRAPRSVMAPDDSDFPAARLGREIADGRTRNAFLQSGDAEDIVQVAGPVVAGGASVLVVAPSALEAIELQTYLAGAFGDVVMTVTPETSDRDVTTIWSRAASQSGYIVIGTPRLALWPIANLGAAIVVGEARRAMKDRQTPTVHARELLRARSGVERFALVTTGLVPSTDVAATGTEVIPASGGRPWSLVEFVDRTEEPPGTGPLADRTKHAIAAAVRRGERVLVFTHRRGYAPVFRCVKCRELRVCGVCGARVDREGICRRCGASADHCLSCGSDRFEPLGAGVDRVLELVRRFIDTDKVGFAEDDRLVTVGSVRDLPSVAPCSLAVVVDADGLVLGTDYRAAEEALRALARVCALVGSGHGNRTIIQTANPQHPVLVALGRAETAPFLANELEQRAQFGFPPAGDLIVLECRPCPDDAAGKLSSRLTGISILGPAPIEGGSRWLLQGPDLTSARRDLRKLAGEWRDAGARLRIDVDPIDL